MKNLFLQENHILRKYSSQYYNKIRPLNNESIFKKNYMVEWIYIRYLFEFTNTNIFD